MGKTTWVSGSVFGVIMTTGKSYYVSRRRHVECICKCGKVFWPRWDGVQRGRCNSCGCVHAERLKNSKPASTHGLGNHPLYDIYCRMKAKCYNPKTHQYKDYGGRGVTMCEEWLKDFVVFYNWANANGWRKELDIDKDRLYIEKHGGKVGMMYSPEYCSLVTRKQNSNCRSTSRRLMYNGKSMTCAEWSDELGITQQTISSRLNSLGWSVEKTLSTPIESNGKK